LAQPDGSFGPPTEFGAGLEPGLFAADGIVVGDLNGDRDPDLAVSNYPSNTVSVLLGGTGT
jgi:FG-GAP repeat